LPETGAWHRVVQTLGAAAVPVRLGFMSSLLWTDNGNKTRAEFLTPDTHGRVKTSGRTPEECDARTPSADRC
jgi:hypothetical protein